MRAAIGRWLCPNAQDRARVVENSGRIARARSIASVTIGAGVLYVAPTYGWWMVGLFALSALNTQTLDARMRRSDSPELHAASSILLSQALLAGGAALTGGPRSPIISLIAVPTAFAATRFRARVTVVATVSAIAMIVVVALTVDPSWAANHTAPVLATIALMIGVSAATHAVAAAELHHREEAILDPLTGLLNRNGLGRRFDELAQQARLSDAPISILVCDLDHFKEINDTHGHAVGDAALREIAYALRKELRSFELIYRIGGEEFLILLPGATSVDASTLAQRLCDAARARCPQGLRLTLSVGVSTFWGTDVHFQDLFDAADQALYEAKAQGRDRVIVAGSSPLVATGG